jgi:hypothetical protein
MKLKLQREDIIKFKEQAEAIQERVRKTLAALVQREEDERMQEVKIQNKTSQIFPPYVLPPSGECANCKRKAHGKGMMGYLCDVCLRRNGLPELFVRIEGYRAKITELEKRVYATRSSRATRMDRALDRLEKIVRFVEKSKAKPAKTTKKIAI